MIKDNENNILGIPHEALGRFKTTVGYIKRAQHLEEIPKQEDLDALTFLKGVYPNISAVSKRTTRELNRIREITADSDKKKKN